VFVCERKKQKKRTHTYMSVSQRAIDRSEVLTCPCMHVTYACVCVAYAYVCVAEILTCPWPSTCAITAL
jgi:hypothetical protein